jgi:hypothetical protein
LKFQFLILGFSGPFCGYILFPMRRVLALQILPVLAALLSFAFTLPAPAQNWIQWPASAGGNDHYYALTPAATNWEAAENHAVSWGGTLTTITSANEQDFINRTFLNGPLERRPVWIGLMARPKHRPLRFKLGPVKIEIGNTEPKLDYHWITGEPLNYTNWHPGQPDNFPPGENYVAINWFYSDHRGYKGEWNDTPENGTTGFSGTTTGPYFGIVERDYDPRLPVRPPPLNFPKTVILILIFILPVILLLLFLSFRSRRGKRALPKQRSFQK